MMTVYRPCVAEEYQWAIPIDKQGYKAIWDVLNSRRGAPVADRWIPVRISLWLGDQKSSPLFYADMPWFSRGGLVVNMRAKETLVEVLGDDAEFLPLLNPDEELWFVNSWREIDALDEENSEFKRFPSSGRIMRIIRYAFSEEKVRGAACFKIPQLSEAMFVTDEVVAAVREARLTGTSFQPVWEG